MEEDEETSDVPKLLFRELKYNPDGDQEEVDICDQEASNPPPDPASEHVDGKASAHSLTWIRVLNQSNRYDYSEARIECLELQALLHIALEHSQDFHYADDDLDGDITLSSLFEPLVHNWTKLTGLASGEEDNEHVKRLASRLTYATPRTDVDMTKESPHLKALRTLADKPNLEKATKYLAMLLTQVRRIPELTSYFESFEKSDKLHSIEFKNLWAIFPPGELVYSSVFMGRPQIFVVNEKLGELIVGSEGGRDEKTIWRLLCWSYDWNGTVFNRVPVVLSFDEFQSSRVITTLPHYPLRYHTKRESITTMMVKRGKRFRDLCTRCSGSQMFHYDGMAIVHGTGFQKFGSRDIVRFIVVPHIYPMLLQLINIQEDNMDFFGRRLLRERRITVIPKKSVVRTQQVSPIPLFILFLSLTFV